MHSEYLVVQHLVTHGEADDVVSDVEDAEGERMSEHDGEVDYEKGDQESEGF